MKGFIYILICILGLTACTKKGTLNREHWTKKMAGTYTVQKVQTQTYSNNTLVTDDVITGDNTQFVLSKSGGDGDGFPLAIYGTWKPLFLNVSTTEYAWCVENDNKRLTLGHFDPSIGFYADGTLSVDNMKKKIQVWHYIRSGTAGGIDTYIHQTITLKKE